MQVQHRYLVHSSLQRTVQAHRDDVAGYGTCFPGIAKVSLGRRAPEAGGRIAVPQRWEGDVGWIPAPLRSLIGADAFQWVIHTSWSREDCDWRLVVPALGEHDLIVGRYTFVSVSDGTEVRVDARLDFDAGTVAARLGLGALQRVMLPVLERFVAALFTTVMERSSAVIAAWIGDDAGRIAA